jgi:hypothetical protein
MKKFTVSHNFIENHPINYTLLFDWVLKSIPDIFDGLNSKKIKSKYIASSGVPDLKLWLKLYKKSKHITFTILEEFCDHYSDCECFLSMIYFHLFLPRKDQIELFNAEIIKYNALSEINKKLYMAEIRSFNNKLKSESDKIINDDFAYIPKNDAINSLQKVEYLFLISVIMPCLVIHGELPSSLIRKARLGDISALEKIIQIDNSSIYDVKISKFMHKLSLTNKIKYNSICKLLLKNHKSFSKKKIKINFASILSQVSKLYGRALKISPLTSEQIRAKFDDNAKNQGLGLIDLDLPDSPEAFYKQMYRKDDFLKFFDVPDKN